jgi:hypothetical protein
MLLRRITKHVKDQNWFAVGIDFCIVVIGVFIGLQVANWNDSRNEQRRAQNYLERLTQDMRVNMEVLAGRENSYAMQIDYGLTALEATQPPETREDAWIIIRAFFQASHAFTITLNRGTYDEIINSGNLALLQDQELVDALSEFYAFGGFATIEDIPDYRVNLRRRVPFHVQRYFLTECYEITMPDTHFLLDCPPPEDADNLIDLARQLQSDEELKRDLQFMLSYADVSAGISRNRTRNVEYVLAVISNNANGKSSAP